MRIAATMRLLGVFLVAVLTSVLSGSIVQSQFNLARLSELGTAIPLDVRLGTTAQDLLGFSPTFGPIVMIGFLIAFLIAGLISRWLPTARAWLFPLAGATAILTALMLMQMVFQITVVAASRGPWGLAALCACGAFGGWVFTALRPAKR